MRIKLLRWTTAAILAVLFRAAGWWLKRFDDVYPESGGWM